MFISLFKLNAFEVLHKTQDILTRSRIDRTICNAMFGVANIGQIA